MNVKPLTSMLVMSFVLLTAAAGARQVALGTSASVGAGGTEASEPYEESYSLSQPRTDMLALLLRHNPLRQTTIKTEASSHKMVVIAPKRVHDVLEPFVRLLNEESAAIAKKEMEQRAKEMLDAITHEAREGAAQGSGGRLKQTPDVDR